jgi:hypothetical protein
MKQIMLSIIAVVCLAGFTSLSYAEDTEKTSKGQKDKSHMGLSDMKGKTGPMSTHKTPGELASEQVKPGDRSMTDDKTHMGLSDMKGKTGPMSTH